MAAEAVGEPSRPVCALAFGDQAAYRIIVQKTILGALLLSARVTVLAGLCAGDPEDELAVGVEGFGGNPGLGAPVFRVTGQAARPVADRAPMK